MADKPIDTTNKSIVGASGGGVVIMNPPRGLLSPDDAINLAVYLVLLSEDKATHRFQEVLEAVEAI